VKTVYLFIVPKGDESGEAYGNAIAEDDKTLGYIDGNSAQEVKSALQEKNYPGHQKNGLKKKIEPLTPASERPSIKISHKNKKST
jgi:hypothetical protein